MINTCSCEEMERMREEMAARRNEMPERVRLCCDLLLNSAGGEGQPCCMMVWWLYYAFFCENTHSVSEEARHIMLPLIEGRMVSDLEECEWVRSGKPER